MVNERTNAPKSHTIPTLESDILTRWGLVGRWDYCVYIVPKWGLIG